MASRLAQRYPEFYRMWLAKPAVAAPIYLCWGTALAFATYQVYRLAVKHPEVSISVENRSALLRDNAREAQEFYNHSLRATAKQRLEQGEVGIFTRINRAMTKVPRVVNWN